MPDPDAQEFLVLAQRLAAARCAFDDAARRRERAQKEKEAALLEMDAAALALEAWKEAQVERAAAGLPSAVEPGPVAGAGAGALA